MKLILAIFLCLAITKSFAKDFCYSFKLEKQNNIELKIKNSSKKNFVTVESLKGEEIFFCTNDSGSYKCSGDDDSGKFSFDSKKMTLTIQFITFGNPDNVTLEVTKHPETKGKSCL
ncbi:hypothetical protein [Halobacteriovorax sp. JY17]|uniref:hypothetical protein n=1 Tax=Halobacteriovorax sp. JY17 TaxID=2014617 RepID=UPI000C3CDA74|nr:hypothetical protein [Halobacteriovorax sp. JY17]PIK16449.1 MAG: hypothetical protein CES88_06830 [Halobacteriovorax sp. JY17]